VRAVAAIVVAGALLLLLALSNGPWAQATFAADGVETEDADEDQRLDVDLHPTGEVEVRPGDSELADAYRSDDSATAREALRHTVPGGARDLAQVLAVLVALVAAVGIWRDLTPGTWLLVCTASLACLVTVVLLRDDVLSAAAAGTAPLGLGVPDVDATGWSALAVAGAATAALVAGLAAGPRPARPMRPFQAVRRGRSTVPVVPAPAPRSDPPPDPDPDLL
jgi:hypothetical protein